MVSLQPNANVFFKTAETHTSFSYSQQQRYSQNDSGTEVESTVNIRYQSVSRSHTFAPNGVEKYQAINDSDQPTSAASNILTFIKAQIQRDIADGATEEELASRLQAGLDGFLQGFGEAFEQISAMGWLDNEEVGAAVKKTHDDVVSGIAALAEELGIEAPQNLPELFSAEPPTEEPVAPVIVAPAESQTGTLESKDQADSQVITAFAEQQKTFLSERAEASASATTAAESGYRSYEFQVKTRDGDVVTISASSEYGRAFAIDDSGTAFTGYNNDFFNFSVSGELDENELAAINDLLKQVNDVADVFFYGDVFAAYEQALEIGFNDEELVQFSMNLTQVKVTKVETAYRDVQDNGEQQIQPPVNRAMVLGEFINKLEILQKGLEQMGVNFEIAENLFDMIGQDLRDRHPHAEKFGEMARRFGRHG